MRTTRRRILPAVVFAAWVFSMDMTAAPGALPLESGRKVDDSYQVDKANYERRIGELRHILAVRAEPQVKKTLLGAEVRIINRGRAEAFSLQGRVYLDIALLDLLARFADELSLAEVKNDAYHQVEFNLAYAAALNGNKSLDLLDAFNTSDYSKEQWRYLWEEKLKAEKVIFDNIAGFIIAHEMSHLVLDHERAVYAQFPNEGERNAGNVAWVQKRRAIELEADQSGAKICLNALVQPVMLVPWIDLNETRRRYYGTTADYPTSAQRIAVVERAYLSVVGKTQQDIELTKFNPLPPDRNIMQGDIHLYLEEFRKVRAFRQSLLTGLDGTMFELLGNGVPVPEVSRFFYEFIEEKRELLNGARLNTEVDKALRLAEGAETGEKVDVAELTRYLERAGMGRRAMGAFRELLQTEPVDWKDLHSRLQILRSAPKQFADGLDYVYLLSNTRLRWQPDVFAALLRALPPFEAKAKELKPYVIGQPLRRPLPTYEQKLGILRAWDGKYP